MAEVAVVFGARNVGRAVLRRWLADGGEAVAVVASATTADLLRAELPAVTVHIADARLPEAVGEALAVAEGLGALSLVVNAITAPPRDQSFGGGLLSEAPDDRLASWMDGFVPMAWQVVRHGAAALRDAGGGTLVQVAGGSARRAFPGRGPWGAAQHAVRALVQAGASEFREQGVHLCLVVADGFVETERRPLGDDDPRLLLHPDDVAGAVAYLHGQSPRGWTHELVLTPSLEPWTPATGI